MTNSEISVLIIAVYSLFFSLAGIYQYNVMQRDYDLKELEMRLRAGGCDYPGKSSDLVKSLFKN